MVTKPMLFNTDMVRSILDGRKTVTRRVVKPQPPRDFPYCHLEGDDLWCWTTRDGDDDMMDWWPSYEHGVKPPYHPGDILYVRETWTIVGTDGTHHKYGYKADNERLAPLWRPSTHMPKEAARIFLRVTDVRVERLQDIDKWGVDREGQPSCSGLTLCGGTAGCSMCEAELENAIRWFSTMWDKTIKPADIATYGWLANPWVWVIEFQRISRGEALRNE